MTKNIFFINCKLLLFCLVFSASPFFNLFAQNTLHTAVPQGFKDGLQSLLMQSIAENLETDIEIKEVPFARRLHYLETGSIDIGAELLKNSEREKYIYFIDPPYKLKSKKIFIVQKGKSAMIQKYEDLYNLKIGTGIKSSYFNRFDNDMKITKESAPSFNHNIKKLISERIDAVIYTESFAFMKIKEMGFENLLEAADFSYSKDNPVYFGISKKSELINNLEKTEKVIKKMILKGDIDKIINKYFLKNNIPVPEYK